MELGDRVATSLKEADKVLARRQEKESAIALEQRQQGREIEAVADVNLFVHFRGDGVPLASLVGAKDGESPGRVLPEAVLLVGQDVVERGEQSRGGVGGGSVVFAQLLGVAQQVFETNAILLALATRDVHRHEQRNPNGTGVVGQRFEERSRENHRNSNRGC
jgi:hypothetical protein